MKKVLKKFPKGSDLHYGWNVLSLWGDRIATIEGPHYRSAEGYEFDPELIARRYLVYFTNLDPHQFSRSVGQTIHFTRGDVKLWETPFSFYNPVSPSSRSVGQITGPPEEIWVEVGKLSNLNSSEVRAVEKVLEQKGYLYLWRSRLEKVSGAKWKKLLAMSFDETQETDLADQAYYLAEDAAEHYHLDKYNDAELEKAWDRIKGIYAHTKKGGFKYIISRKPNKRGL